MHHDRIAGRHSLAPALAALLAIGFAAGPGRAMPLVSELFYDAVGSDDGQSFVEISGEPGSSLEGFVIEGVNGSNGDVGPSITLSGVIGDDGLFVVADVTSEGVSAVVGADLLANFDFQNGPDSVVLRQADLVVDAVGYGVFGAGEIFAGEGSPAEDAPAGASLARWYADLDLDDNALDFRVLASPTPGAADFMAVPEPASGLLAGGGLAVLAGLCRRQGRRARVVR
jgi:hypothetical protein